MVSLSLAHHPVRLSLCLSRATRGRGERGGGASRSRLCDSLSPAPASNHPPTPPLPPPPTRPLPPPPPAGKHPHARVVWLLVLRCVHNLALNRTARAANSCRRRRHRHVDSPSPSSPPLPPPLQRACMHTCPHMRTRTRAVCVAHRDCGEASPKRKLTSPGPWEASQGPPDRPPCC